MIDYGKNVVNFLKDSLKRDYIYNEFSLQFELGIYLREQLRNEESPARVYFEKNVYDLWPEEKYEDKNKGKKKCKNFTKTEIDLSIMQDEVPTCAIELKFPRNGQYPEEMFAFIKDIKFLEELKHKGFKEAYAVCLVDSASFTTSCSSRCSKDGIYAYFRDRKFLEGTITKPTGNPKDGEDKEYTLCGKYKIEWISLGQNRWYYIIQIPEIRK